MTDAGVITRPGRIAAADLERLVALGHDDPHSILGAHPAPGGVTIRAFRPDAKQVSVIDDENRSWPMTRIDDRGLFETVITDRCEVFRYQLRIVESERSVLTIRDAYAFLPTIGSLDLHLWNEGRHLQIYEKLGAHLHEI